jgi:hypothetical protein
MERDQTKERKKTFDDIKIQVDNMKKSEYF